ncbi:transcription antiterminator LicT [Bacillus haynesii]|uniref:Transcription antiterminator LicT n=1 Tax=Bacillus haynesii TaxID=1925021 RepID=A0ABX3I440_9BACI|nr:PRD domain-containing protein [Bacillus haynesii]OMI27140.1 transcription antiterminator LicT [Bacillus haynesii]
MRVVKKINNNVALCIDDNHREVIAFGNGIGFPKTPYELSDLSKIRRTYYGLNSHYQNLLNQIPEDIFEIAAKIVDYAKTKIDKEFNPNIVFTLADHINFAIQRYEKKMYVKMPLGKDVRYLYNDEMLIGEKALNYINKVKKINLPNDEAVSIALHLINSEHMAHSQEDKFDDEQVIEQIVEIIENIFGINIDRKSFNYSRFLSHIHYVLKREDEQISINSDNIILFESMKKEFEQSYHCAVEISEYLKNKIQRILIEEELLYLMLHINRLCTKEGCYQ